ncbi:MAG: hypothetical protein ACI831_001701, partial [Candidatus Azotimanducaceae bacterium]
MQAVCLRYLGQYEQAISTLGILQNKFPLFSRAFQEEGHLQIARIDPDS